MLAKCVCNNCPGHIEFDENSAGQTVTCPHCGKETVLNTPQLQSPQFYVWQNDQQQGPFSQDTVQQMISEGQITNDTLLCPEDGAFDWTPVKELFHATDFPEQAGDVSLVETRISPYQYFTYQRVKVDEKSFVRIRLISGEEFRIKAVQLYDRQTLAEVSAKRAEAWKKQQGASTGVGAIGSPGFVLASSIIIGAIDQSMSASAAAQATKLLTDAIQIELNLRNDGTFIPVNTIKNIEHPLPEIWVVLGEVTIIRNGAARKLPAAFIHNGDEFLTVQIEDNSIRSVRWSAVESYAYQTPSGAQANSRPPRILPA